MGGSQLQRVQAIRLATSSGELCFALMRHTVGHCGCACVHICVCSWSPRSVLLNTVNAAQYLNNGEVSGDCGDVSVRDVEVSRQLVPLPCMCQVVAIPGGGELMDHFKEVSVSGVQFEGLPNRDSLKYRSLYGIGQVETLLRGSLRNKVCAGTRSTAMWCGVL